MASATVVDAADHVLANSGLDRRGIGDGRGITSRGSCWRVGPGVDLQTDGGNAMRRLTVFGPDGTGAPQRLIVAMLLLVELLVGFAAADGRRGLGAVGERRAAERRRRRCSVARPRDCAQRWADSCSGYAAASSRWATRKHTPVSATSNSGVRARSRPLGTPTVLWHRSISTVDACIPSPSTGRYLWRTACRCSTWIRARHRHRSTFEVHTRDATNAVANVDACRPRRSVRLTTVVHGTHRRPARASRSGGPATATGAVHHPPVHALDCANWHQLRPARAAVLRAAASRSSSRGHQTRTRTTNRRAPARATSTPTSDVPGGFGWLQRRTSGVHAASRIADELGSTPTTPVGRSSASDCAARSRAVGQHQCSFPIRRLLDVANNTTICWIYRHGHERPSTTSAGSPPSG